MKIAAPGAPPQARRQLATRLVLLLNGANEGAKLGVEKNPDFGEKLAIAKLQLMDLEAKRELQTQASNVSDPELKTYYDQNASAFEEVTLTRLFVPRTPADPKQTEQPADPKAIADNARQQLMIGTDPDKIEKGIFDQLKSTNPPPSSKFGAHRRGTLPATQEQKVFDLKDGEISEVFSDPSGYVVYRVDQRRQLPFEQVKDDVKQRIVRQKLIDLGEQITSASKAEYNDAYFGPETASPRMGNPGGAPRGARPPGAASNVPPVAVPTGQPAAAPSPK
jgi:foldase protein PrsA